MKSLMHHSSRLEIPFPSEREAEIATNTLKVDKEPKRGGCVKQISCEGKVMHV